MKPETDSLVLCKQGFQGRGGGAVLSGSYLVFVCQAVFLFARREKRAGRRYQEARGDNMSVRRWERRWLPVKLQLEGEPVQRRMIKFYFARPLYNLAK